AAARRGAFDTAIEIWTQLQTAEVEEPQRTNNLLNLGNALAATGALTQARTVAEEAARSYEDQGDDEGVSLALANQAYAELRLGLTAEAEIHYDHALTVARRSGYWNSCACALVGVAAVHAASGNAREAAQAIGDLGTLLDGVGGTLEALEQALYDETMAELGKQVGRSELLTWIEQSQAAVGETHPTAPDLLEPPLTGITSDQTA
ncbi:MAG: hypothetical protein ACXWZ1_07355, partial [Gaiellaceae bacterium]